MDTKINYTILVLSAILILNLRRKVKSSNKCNSRGRLKLYHGERKSNGHIKTNYILYSLFLFGKKSSIKREMIQEMWFKNKFQLNPHIS